MESVKRSAKRSVRRIIMTVKNVMGMIVRERNRMCV